MPFRITEAQSNLPHNTRYTHTGRGGAGNYHHLPPPPASAAPTATPPSAAPAAVDATPAPPRHHHRRPSMSSNPAGALPLHSTASRYATGRGGAGNIYTASERPMFFFDEELERMYARDEHAAPVFHIGRGGAGNTMAGPPASLAADAQSLYGPRTSADSSRRSSNSSADSEARGKFSGDEVLRRLSQTFSRRP